LNVLVCHPVENAHFPALVEVAMFHVLRQTLFQDETLFPERLTVKERQITNKISSVTTGHKKRAAK
jgi:hypothetical protein